MNESWKSLKVSARDDLLGGVEQLVGREAGEGAAVVDVGGLAALDLGGDDRLEVVPRLHLEVHLDVGVLLLETGDDVFPEALGVVGVARDEQVEGGGAAGGVVTGPAAEAAGCERQRGGGREGDRRAEAQRLLHGCFLTLVDGAPGR